MKTAEGEECAAGLISTAVAAGLTTEPWTLGRLLTEANKPSRTAFAGQCPLVDCRSVLLWLIPARPCDMSRSRHKRQKPNLTPAEREAELDLLAGLKNGTIIAVDKSKVFSRSVCPQIPDYYRDVWFTCKDCGKEETWSAEQQKTWYEEQGGEIEAIAIRCHACRGKEKLRREAARKIHLEGLARKRSRTL